jgi:hypothetical protein
MNPADYVDENGNLLEDFELPAPAGNGKPVSAGGNSSSSKSAAVKLPSISMPAYPQQQQQQQQQLEIKPLAVDACRMQQPYSFGGQQIAAAADGGWQHHQMLMQQQQARQHQQPQQHMWHEQQQQHMWHEQQQQQSLQSRQLLKSQTWQEHLLSQHSQQGQAQQHAAAAAGCFSGQMLQSKSLPANTAAVNVATGTAAAPGSSIANQTALMLAQRRSGQPNLTAADGCSSEELLIPAAAAAAGQDCQACQPGSMFAASLPAAGAAAAAGSLRQAGVTVTTSVGFGGNSTGVGSFAGMVQDMQQQHQQQMLAPELAVAELDLPPLLPLMPSSSMAAGSAMHMQQQQQMPSMPRYGMHPNQQLGTTWQQQQQSAASNGCPGMLNSFGSSASAAQQYAQQSSPPQLQITVNVNAGTGSGTGPAQSVFSSGSLHALGSDCSAHALSMSAPMQQPASLHCQTASVSASMLQPAAMHQQMQLSSSSSMRPSGLPGHTLARQNSGMGHAPAVTHALSARMASCELGEAIQLARQAAAAQGVTDFTGALRQMSSAQLPVITAASGSNLQVLQQQQQQNAAAGGVGSSGLLQYQGSGVSASVSSMSAGTSSCGPQPLVGMQLPVQPMASHASTGQSLAAAAAASIGSPTTPSKHALTQECGTAVATACDAATAAPASKRARTSSLHDDGQVPSCN